MTILTENEADMIIDDVLTYILDKTNSEVVEALHSKELPLVLYETFCEVGLVEECE